MLFPVEDSTGYIALGGNPSYVDTWRAMEKLVSKGKVKALGVSNFNQKEIQDILDQCELVCSPLSDREDNLIYTLIRHLQPIKWNYTVSATNTDR